MKNYGCIEVAGQWPENSWKSMAALLTPCVAQILCDTHHLLRAWAAMLVYQKIAHVSATRSEYCFWHERIGQRRTAMSAHRDEADAQRTSLLRPGLTPQRTTALRSSPPVRGSELMGIFDFLI